MFLTRLICARLDTQGEAVSKRTSRPLAEDARVRSFPSRDILKSGSLASSCLLLKTMSFVLSRFESRKFLKHQLCIKRRPLFKLFVTVGQLRFLKEI